MTMKQTLTAALLALLTAGVQAQTDWQQRVDTELSVTLDDVNHELRGQVRIAYQNNSPETLEHVWIHLWPNAYRNGSTAMAKQHYRDGDMFMFYAMSRDLGGIDSLAFTSAKQPLTWNYHPEHIDIAKVELAKPLPPGGRVVLETPFRVDIPSGSISRLGHVGESYQITQWFPKPAVYDDEGWHPMPYLSQGEFFSEYGSYDVKITLPANYTVGATGDLVPGSEDNDAEKSRLDSLAADTKMWVKNQGWKDAENTFPESSHRTKTLHYRQDNVHDFAWFADKRYKVLRGTVVLPRDKRKVTTWAMFTPEEGELWQKAPEYLHDATYCYSLWNGNYPYNQVTAVDGTISAGGGMEYPNVTVIGTAGSDSGLETVIVHEVGHNWFYGILGSNERENAWMDEGINSFNETRYLLTKYGENKDISLLLGGENNLAQRFELEDFQYKWIDELSYLFPARFGADQPIQCHSNSLTSLNYGAIIYKKTAAAFAMLQSHLGEVAFDKAMQLYFDQWKFRHPAPEDLQLCLEKSTGEDLSWFFGDWIQTTKRNDLALVKASADKGLTVKNVGDLPSSAKISAMQGDSILAEVDVPLTAPGARTTVDVPAVSGVDRWVLDEDRVTLDYDRSNNVRQASGLFKGMEPLQLRMLTRLEDPDKTQVFWLPALGWNAHNGLMAGVTLHNMALPPRDFTYQWTPLFSVREFGQGVDFGGILAMDWRKDQWHVGMRSSQFRADEAMQRRPKEEIDKYDGDLLTRTSLTVERKLNAAPASPWKGVVRYEGVHVFGHVDFASDVSSAVRLQRRASRLELAAEQRSTDVPGLSQEGSLLLGRVVTEGFRLDTLPILPSPPATQASAVTVQHLFADAWWHVEYAKPRRGREHTWSLDGRVTRVGSQVVDPELEFNWADSRNLDNPDFGTAVAGTGAQFDPLADQLLLNRGVSPADGWTGRQASLDRGGLPLDMVAPQGLWSVRAGYDSPLGLGLFAGAVGAWSDGVDAVGGSDLEVVSNAVVGVSLPLGPLEFQIPVWTAEAAEGTQPWEAWMFKLDLRSLNPLSLVRQNLQ